jgi:hypothetical protein
MKNRILLRSFRGLLNPSLRSASSLCLRFGCPSEDEVYCSPKMDGRTRTQRKSVSKRGRTKRTEFRPSSLSLKQMPLGSFFCLFSAAVVRQRNRLVPCQNDSIEDAERTRARQSRGKRRIGWLAVRILGARVLGRVYWGPGVTHGPAKANPLRPRNLASLFPPPERPSAPF